MGDTPKTGIPRGSAKLYTRTVLPILHDARWTALVGAACLAGCAVAALAQMTAHRKSMPLQAPAFRVDPTWPKPLPNHWIVGSVVGVAVDARDHVWIVHRPSTLQ